MDTSRIYLDYNATTPVAPEVDLAIRPFLAEHFGNPSSNHALGRACSEAISDAREQLAALIGADADEVFFTGGGTESNNLALKGIFLSGNVPLGAHFITSSIEHPAISEPAAYLRKLGFEVTIVSCNHTGQVDPDDIRRAITTNTKLVSIMLANNEVGTLQPISEIAQICREHDVLLHTDAAQAVGKVPVNVSELGVDMMTVAGHKLYAPKGIGAIYISDTVDIEPLLHGAAHERGIRAGTENTPYIVGLGKAARLAASRLSENPFDCTMRDELWQQLLSLIPDELQCNGMLAERLPNTLSVAFPRVSGEALLRATPEVFASTGAACHSKVTRMSATLAAMGVSEKQAIGTVRLSTGRYSTSDEIARAAELLSESWRRLVG
jgi:cysteine desulfurase